MNDTPAATANDVTLNANIELTYFDSGQPDRAEFSFRVDNDGPVPIGILKTGGARTGDSLQPVFRISAAGDLTIAYEMDAGVDARLAGQPNVYAVRVEPGEHYSRQLSVKLLAAYPEHGTSALIGPERVRICQAYVPFASQWFVPLGDEGAVWLARPGAGEAQVWLCSQWVEVRT